MCNLCTCQCDVCREMRLPRDQRRLIDRTGRVPVLGHASPIERQIQPHMSIRETRQLFGRPVPAFPPWWFEDDDD